MRTGKVTVLAVIISAVLMSTACSGGSASPSAEAPSATPTETKAPADGGTYGSVEELRDAYIDAGGTCDEWNQTNRITLAAESAECDVDTVLSVYLSKGDIAQLVQKNKELNEQLDSDDKSTWLTGQNWVINDADATSLKEKLGGTLVSF